MSGTWEVHGWAFIETGGVAPVNFELFDGFDTGGQSIIPFSLGAGQSVRDWLGRDGIFLYGGLFVNVTVGSVRGTIWMRYRERSEGY